MDGIFSRLSNLTPLRLREAEPKKCTASSGLEEALPADLLPYVLSHLESAEDVMATAATCKAFKHAALDPSQDELIWEPLCHRRWATRAYWPPDVHPIPLHHRNHRHRYIWAEQDGQRQLGTGEDLACVEVWRVKFWAADPYLIGDFPYRTEGLYFSPSFGNEPKRWSVKSGTAWRGGNVVVVDGLSDVRMIRRPDWGWELRNSFWSAQSVRHSFPPSAMNTPNVGYSDSY